MSLYRRAARRDGSEPAIRAILERLGYLWQPLSIPGGPDAIVARQGQMWLIECKSVTNDKRQAKLRPNQVAWHQKWTGPAPVILRSAEDALRWGTAPMAATQAKIDRVSLD